MERPDRLTLFIAAGAVVLVAAAAMVWMLPENPEGEPPRIPGEGPRGRVTVEVLNATTEDGLARRATRHLRRQGLDVVNVGSHDAVPERDTTLVIIRRGDRAAGEWVLEALGTGRLVSEPAPERLLDVSVWLGRDAVSIVSDP